MSKEYEIGRVTIKGLQDLFERADRSEESREWEAALQRVSRKWRQEKQALTEAEVEFLAVSFAAIFDTSDQFVQYTEAEFPQSVEELRSDLRGAIGSYRDVIADAWRRLGEAMVQQVQAADEARARGEPCDSKTLKKFYTALNALKQTVKQHSGSPGHRRLESPERDKTIHKMRRAGKTYAQIARDLPRKNREWKVTPNQAERIDKRYSERSRQNLLGLLRAAFRQLQH